MFSPRFLFSLCIGIMAAVFGLALANKVFNAVLGLLARQTDGLGVMGIEVGTFLFLSAGTLALATVVTARPWRTCLIFFIPGLVLLLFRSAVALLFGTEGIFRLGMAVEFMAAAAGIAGVLFLFRQERRRMEPMVEPGYRQYRV